MRNLSGCLTARLAGKDESYSKNLVGEINRRVKPPRPVTPDDVYIRAMYIVSDQVNSQGGRFAEEELDRLAELLVDSPVMVGHKRDSLPVARNFKAEKVVIDGRTWIRSYFYWMKESDGAEDLKNNIDGGIYKECSISFLFRFPECSICGKDIRECRHIPFQEYEVSPGSKEIAHFKYRGIEKVLETSLVFRGSVPDTRITDKLSSSGSNRSITETVTSAALFSKSDDAAEPGDRSRSFGSAILHFEPFEGFQIDEQSVSLFIFPYQPGLIIRVRKKDGRVELESKLLLPETVRCHLAEALSVVPIDSFIADLLLFATRGKERLNGLGLMQIIETEKNLHRLRLRFCDLIEADGRSFINDPCEKRLGQLADIFGDFKQDNIEVLHPRKIGAKNHQSGLDQSEVSRYSFGLEVVAENDNGILSRHILSRDSLTPAQIKRVSAKSREHLSCTIRPIGERGSLLRIVCPKAAGTEKGAVALLSGVKPAGGKNSSGIKVIDLLPGTESIDIAAITKCDDNEGEKLYMAESDNRLILCFKSDRRWHRIIVYHFSAHLFRLGRRFIAALDTDGDIPGMRSSMQRAQLKSVSRTGRLMLIRLTRGSSVFGDTSGLWLRPVLIDGQERFLFYADGVTRHQEGL
jgi:hypothetical protein